MKLPLTLAFWLCVAALGSAAPTNGLASWYGEAHRGKLMANGKRFNPDHLTAASWFYPLGTKVRVTLQTGSRTTRSVLVTITDRGPSFDLVREGRIIDLAHSAFKRLGEPDLGLIPVTVRRVKRDGTQNLKNSTEGNVTGGNGENGDGKVFPASDRKTANILVSAQ